jgi:hypothetical protein
MGDNVESVSLVFSLVELFAFWRFAGVYISTWPAQKGLGQWQGFYQGFTHF